VEQLLQRLRYRDRRIERAESFQVDARACEVNKEQKARILE